MTSFLGKLMFWRRPTDGEASERVPNGGANDSTPLTPEQQQELDHEARRREQYLEERRREDEFRRGGHSREDEILRERREFDEGAGPPV
jgi:hypothetical protein